MTATSSECPACHSEIIIPYEDDGEYLYYKCADCGEKWAVPKDLNE